MFSKYRNPGRPGFQNMEILDVQVFIGRPCFLENRPIVQHPYFTSTPHFVHLILFNGWVSTKRGPPIWAPHLNPPSGPPYGPPLWTPFMDPHRNRHNTDL